MEDSDMDGVAFDGAQRLLDLLERDWVDDVTLATEGDWPPAPPVRREIITLLRQKLNQPAPAPAPAAPPPTADVSPIQQTSHDYLTRLAHYFSGEEVTFESPDQIRAFCERIRRSVMIMVSELRQLLSGRRQFQEEFSMVSSRAVDDDIGATRMIRRGDIHGDLGKFLFDWRAQATTGQHTKALETAIDELKHHQMALLSGFRHSLKEGTRAVLEEMSPETIAHGGSSLGAINPFRHASQWSRYAKRYDEILNEDIGWYQDRFLRAFREGYLEYMWGAKSKENADAGSPAGGNDGA
jgi:predicted component of type VI protein secretion system